MKTKRTLGMGLLLIAAVMASVGCDQQSHEERYQVSPLLRVRIVLVYCEPRGGAEDWQTVVEFDNGIRKMMQGQMGREGDAFYVRTNMFGDFYKCTGREARPDAE